MADCLHIPDDTSVPAIVANGCEDCLKSDHRNWVHLRYCQECGKVGCCDSSPGKHATKHYHDSDHALIRSFEPGEDWWWCYVDEEALLVEGSPPSPSHEGTR